MKKLLVSVIMILFVGAGIIQVSAETFHSVYGTVYIGGNPAPSGTEVKITFDDGSESDIIDLDNGYYQIDWQSPNNEHEWPIPGGVGDFTVIIGSSEYIPDDNKTIKIYSGITGYSVNLSLEIFNNPPNAPSNPNPSNGANNVDTNKTLSWSCSDPDGDPLTYDVYFGNGTSPPLVSSGQTTRSYDPPGAMNYYTTYYWQIVAHDDKGASTTGPIWIFTTELEANNPPDKPTIDGPITGKPGVEYTYYANTTDPDGDQVFYKWDWGDNSYSEWLGPYNSGIEIPASHAWSQGSFEIRVKAKDTRGLESEWSDPFPITMPRDKIINNLFFRLLENHPFLYQLLQLL